jgi:hypothetical protein
VEEGTAEAVACGGTGRMDVLPDAAATISLPPSFYNNKKAASGASRIFLDRDGCKNYIERKTDMER